MKKKKKSFSAYAKLVATYEFTCPECNKEVQVTGDFSIVGGCTGHDPGEYCYCDSKRIEADVTCPSCGKAGELRIDDF